MLFAMQMRTNLVWWLLSCCNRLLVLLRLLLLVSRVSVPGSLVGGVGMYAVCIVVVDVDCIVVVNVDCI